MTKYDDLALQQDEPAEPQRPHNNTDKAEWVAKMCLIAKRDRDLYRKLRAEAWDSVVRSGGCSKDSN
jgi:hypothetical protein